MESFRYHDLGRIAYADALEYQTAAFEVLLDAKATGKKEDNQLFFCEHLPVLTIGKSGKDSNLLIPEETLRERGVSFYHINRGGDITYHGPGQITGYPVFDLEYWNLGLKQYIHMLEETIIRFLSLYDLKGERFLGLIENSIKEHWDLPAFSDYNGHTFHYKDVARRIEKFHIILEHAGIKKGDKVALVGRNSSNWAICFFGILAYGAVAVPILHEFKPDNIHHIVNHSEAKAVLAASSNWENMNERMMPDVKLFMMLDNFSIIHSKSKEVRVVRDRINEYFGKLS